MRYPQLKIRVLMSVVSKGALLPQFKAIFHELNQLFFSYYIYFYMF